MSWQAESLCLLFSRTIIMTVAGTKRMSEASRAGFSSRSTWSQKYSMFSSPSQLGERNRLITSSDST